MLKRICDTRWKQKQKKKNNEFRMRYAYTRNAVREKRSFRTFIAYWIVIENNEITMLDIHFVVSRSRCITAKLRIRCCNCYCICYVVVVRIHFAFRLHFSHSIRWFVCEMFGDGKIRAETYDLLLSIRQYSLRRWAWNELMLTKWLRINRRQRKIKVRIKRHRRKHVNIKVHSFSNGDGSLYSRQCRQYSYS